MNPTTHYNYVCEITNCGRFASCMLGVGTSFEPRIIIYDDGSKLKCKNCRKPLAKKEGVVKLGKASYFLNLLNLHEGDNTHFQIQK